MVRGRGQREKKHDEHLRQRRREWIGAGQEHLRGACSGHLRRRPGPRLGWLEEKAFAVGDGAGVSEAGGGTEGG